ncbi:MAG: hypothetical protein INR62_04025, partial [Rhodospirillales bacterium]|nr:hypothetical protein [Acetobacter sp.]
MTPRRKLARREQTQRTLDRLTSDFAKWLEKRRNQDKVRLQFATALTALDTEINGALGAIREQVRGVDLALSAGAFYEACAQCDRLLAWLWGVFVFFRERFDQRDDPALAATLGAAD